MKRRQFVQLSSLTAVGAFLVNPFEADANRKHPEDEVLASPDLLALLDDERTVREIGRVYRAHHEHENDARTLRARLVSSLGKHNILSKDILKQQIASDFESGKTLQVRGWILSITEVRQCALYSLLHP